MTNSLSASIYSTLIALLAIASASDISVINRSISKLSGITMELQPDFDTIKTVSDYINNRDEIKDYSDSDTSVEFRDISSRIDLNFIDFTLFKRAGFNRLLKPGVGWQDLENFREESGFTSNIKIYRSFFTDDTDFDRLFTPYSIPNINTMSDLSLKQLYMELTENEFKSDSLMEYIQNKRKNRDLINEEELEKLFLIYGRILENRVSVIPGWNKNRVSTTLSYLTSDFSEREKMVYFGGKTTFYQVEIRNEAKKSLTTAIYKWSISDKEYSPISIITGEM